MGCKRSKLFNYSKQCDQNKLASRFRRLMNFLPSSRCISPGIELWFTFMDCSVGTLSLKPSIFSGKRGRRSFQRLLIMNLGTANISNSDEICNLTGKWFTDDSILIQTPYFRFLTFGFKTSGHRLQRQSFISYLSTCV